MMKEHCSTHVFGSETISANQPLGGTKHRILLVCPQILTREGLRLLLARDEDLRVIGMAADMTGTKDLLVRLKPDVVILVPGLREAEFASAVQSLKADRPDLPVLIVSSDTRPEHVQAALSAGATGYLSWDANVDDLIQAVYTVGRGELTLDRSIVPSLLVDWAGKAAEHSSRSLDELSPRERQVLTYVAQGLGDRDIGQALFISVRTVQTHLTHIYEKLGVHSRTEAAIIAVREGWPSSAKDSNVQSTNQ